MIRYNVYWENIRQAYIDIYNEVYKNFQEIAKTYFNTFATNIWEGDSRWREINRCEGFTKKDDVSLLVTEIILLTNEKEWSALVTFNGIMQKLDLKDSHQLHVINCILLQEIEKKNYGKENGFLQHKMG